jgi:tRNA pseudouridine13 synthase
MSTLPLGRIRERPEDFVVDEIPAYAPSGEGGHVFVRFTKRGMTTPDAVRAIARALGCDPRGAGHAGMKDKWAITSQTISVAAPPGASPNEVARRASGLSLEGITVHEAVPHGNKIKPGHLAGNRFAIAVRNVPRARLGEITGAFERVRLEGLPNAFGAQRFGAGGQNAVRALGWVKGTERPPRDPRLRRLLWSALQSSVYDRVLQARVRDGTWTTPLEGDVLKLRASGGMFVCTDVQTDRARAEAGELSPTGPMVGARMQWPAGVSLELERSIVAEVFGADFDFADTRRLGAGSRRGLRLWVDELSWKVEDDDSDDSDDGSHDSGNCPACVRVYFVLPKGAYATTVLGAAVAFEDKPTRDVEPSASDEAEEEPEGA